MTQTLREPLMYCSECGHPSSHAVTDILKMCARCVRRAPDAVVQLRAQLVSRHRETVAEVARFHARVAPVARFQPLGRMLTPIR